MRDDAVNRKITSIRISCRFNKNPLFLKPHHLNKENSFLIYRYQLYLIKTYNSQ
jgi:hypothetical protein